jgi:ABC-2 type transport system permease protein
MSESPTGQVFDLGFRRYEGQREGRRRSTLAVYKDGLRTAMGLGRGGKAKILPWVFVSASMIPALIFALIAGAVDRVAPDFSEELDLPSHADYYAIAGIILFLFAAMVGPELFCPDRSNRTINLYLVRPLRPTDYAAARWASLVTIMTVVAWIPQLILLLGLTLGAPKPGTYLADHWTDIPRFLLAGIVIAVYVSTITSLAAALAKRRAYAAAFLVGLFILTAAVVGVGSVGAALSDDTTKWIALLSVGGVPLYVNDLIFGEQTSNAAEASELPGVILVGWFLIVVVAAGALVLRRYRKLTL